MPYVVADKGHWRAPFKVSQTGISEQEHVSVRWVQTEAAPRKAPELILPDLLAYAYGDQ